MNVMLRTLVAGSVLMLLASATLSAQAGATAQVGGIVKDESGGVRPGVDVTVTQTATGVTRSAVSDADGAYTLTNLPIGPYRLEATLQGFRSYVQTGIVLRTRSRATTGRQRMRPRVGKACAIRTRRKTTCGPSVAISC